MTQQNNMENDLQKRIETLERQMREHYHNGVVGRQIYFKDIFGSNIFFGSGAPTLSAPKASLYLRTDGSSTSTRAYVNTDGGISWTAITTAT